MPAAACYFCLLIFWVAVSGSAEGISLVRVGCAGRDFIAPCKCKGTSKYVHRDCLDHWRAVKVSAAPLLLRDAQGLGGNRAKWAFSVVS